MYIDKQTERAMRSIARVTPKVTPKKPVRRRPPPMSADALVKKYSTKLDDWKDDFGSAVVFSK